MDEEIRQAIEQTKEQLPVDAADWQNYNPGSHKDIKIVIRNNINSVCANYVAIGYYLNIVNGRKLYEEDGYSGIGEYAAAEYGIQEDKCSYLRKIAKKFCIPNSPALLPEYREFKIQKLREMLYLTDEQLEQVMITTTVAEIRDIRKPEPEKVAISQVEPEPEIYATSHKESEPESSKPSQWPKVCKYDGKSNCVACSATCCAECDSHGSCNTECGWQDERIPKQKVHDEAWFVKQYFESHLEDLAKLMRMCREHKAKGEAAKEFQEYKARYGYSNSSCDEWEYTFRGFTAGVDWRIGQEQIHMKYGRLVEEVLKLYDPSDRKYDENIPETVNDEPEVVDNEPEIVNDVDEPLTEEKSCSNCIYDTMDPDEYRRMHLTDKAEFPCNSCDDKLDHWEQKVEGLVLDCYNEEEGWHEEIVSVEHDQVETVQADIIQTVPADPEQYTYQDIKDEHDKLTEYVDAFRRNNDTVPGRRKAKMRLDAITLLGNELRNPPTAEPPKPVQPELPVLKNNEQRKEWIEAYETWPVWIDLEQTGERYYRYDFEDGTSFVIRVSLQHTYQGYSRTEKIGYGHEEYFLLGVKSKWIPGMPTFMESGSNKSAMVDHLKDLQKKGA